MRVDIEHILFWMEAIRNSTDRDRTLESFWRGQINSKVWLIENLQHYITEPVTIDIHGGWYGVLASLLFQSDSNNNIKHITSLDIDIETVPIAKTINMIEFQANRFHPVNSNMCKTKSSADIIINTSCEHLTQVEYSEWLHLQPANSLIVLQSNNYFDCPEHVNCMHNLKEFEDSSMLDCFISKELILTKYSRYLLIGKKRVNA